MASMSISSSARRPAPLTARQRARNARSVSSRLSTDVIWRAARRGDRRPACAVAARRAPQRLARHRLRHLQPVGDELDQVVLQRARLEPGDDRRDRAQRLVAALGVPSDAGVERPLDLEARDRHRRLQQRAHRLRPLALRRRRPDRCPAGSRTTRRSKPRRRWPSLKTRIASLPLATASWPAASGSWQSSTFGVSRLSASSWRSVSAVPIEQTVSGIPAWRSAITSV